MRRLMWSSLWRVVSRLPGIRQDRRMRQHGGLSVNLSEVNEDGV